MPQKQRSKRLTLKAVAAAAGVAVTTVSKALADDPKIAKATRERVQKIAFELGYVPDRAAQRLRTGKTKVISLVLEPHDELLGFSNSLIYGLTRALEDSGYHLVVTPHFAGGKGVSAVEHIVQNHLADGIIITRTSPTDERIRYLMEQGFPFVSHGRTNFGTPHSFVDFDNERFAELAVERLANKGAKKLCMILPPDFLTFHQHLMTGTIRAANKHGLEYLFAKDVTLDSSLDEVNTWAMEMCQKADRPDAYVFVGEASYFAALSAFRKCGLVRSKDFEVVVKRNSELIHQIDEGVDVVFEDIQKAGEKMGEFILHQMTVFAEPPLQFIDEP
jgi:LacI family transcriptional regulator